MLFFRQSRALATSFRTLATTATHPADVAKPRILVTGSLGQLGIGLVSLLRQKYGNENVIASDIRKPSPEIKAQGPYVFADVLNMQQLETIVVDNDINWIVNLSALLSAVGEQNIDKALAINMTGFTNTLELARRHQLRIMCPSTIGAFGPTTPRDLTPDLTIMRPTTVYGITKVHVELMGEYYAKRFGVDFRSLRYPGIISSDTEPGGGTTDYAVQIFHSALKEKSYKCYLGPETSLPMMYLPDCLEGTVDFLAAPNHLLKQRTYNMAAFSFNPREIAAKIKERIPEFEMTYAPDFRQAIADSWPKSLDDSKARQDWGWKNKFDLDAMTDDMLTALKSHHK
ncbi:NAD(P)-binding protein [Rhizoclosmatium globosum]|uniref:L-threonine 3-dehydrogenase, mitochondrial n=1 Tax=Rhizoclosmatium globosum TaxID=329046 RepID=A0A1Y2C6C9_9FUNG|nr:hypothetical protein HDU99_000492 [Rhizoclosmatium hyalinum]KAJ3292149.1 hypothetical protein HDU79_001720 [Rhizoclosmatium sp. JEL0117]ORY42600.1 NAD(P)-binding protein [Rhizoclosmatium globosum]|eukprot:ORY42600.1 NAD(P)-binding protein [Rhizoclosmatium globosum]